MDKQNQSKKKLNRKQTSSNPATAKPSGTAINMSEDAVSRTLTDLHTSLMAGRRILDTADAILIYYVALVNKNDVISEVKGTSHISNLLQVDRRAEASMTIDTLLNVSINNPLIGKIQKFAEEASIEMEAGYRSEKELKKTLLGSDIDKFITGTNPLDAERPVDPDGVSDDDDI